MVLATDIIERAAARDLADYVSAVNATARGVEAGVVEIGGGIAAYTGIDSPLSTIKGAGPAITDDDIDAAERFFRTHGAGQVTFELAPWADGPSIDRLQRRGYQAAGSESVVLRVVPLEPAAPDSRVELLEATPWADVTLEVSELPPQELWRVLMRAAAHLGGAVNLGVRDEAGAFVASAQLSPVGEVAIFGNDNTHPRARGRGYQRLLIEARLHHAHRLALAHAIAEVAPGSTSERNYLRCGFERRYLRTHYSRDLPQEG